MSHVFPHCLALAGPTCIINMPCAAQAHGKPTHIKYADCLFNEYKNTFHGRHGFSYSTDHVTKVATAASCVCKGGQTEKRIYLEERGKRLATPLSACIGKSHADVDINMEMRNKLQGFLGTTAIDSNACAALQYEGKGHVISYTSFS